MHIFRPEKSTHAKERKKTLVFYFASHDFPCSLPNTKILIFQILFTEFVDWALEKNLDIEDDTEPEAAPAPAEEEAAAPAEEAPAAAEEAPAAAEEAPAATEAEAAPAAAE